ncbi:unnamed protein product [Bursaphelenchus xylophilus]|uniref:(pine wood nematode) hypothetical protein n=1 Tax=Bursaphelenchus xylophilus TaxID=6326 RepID=A0A811LGU4_BURXY|nr:unnamed protein product [Bursaphelenchus xylophilus]CAG9119432.1 unnamed protein product [Bursaphelenchus xylophilus]
MHNTAGEQTHLNGTQSAPSSPLRLLKRICLCGRRETSHMDLHHLQEAHDRHKKRFDNVRSPKNSSATDLTRRVTVVDKPGQDKAHFTGLRGRTAKKLSRRIGFPGVCAVSCPTTALSVVYCRSLRDTHKDSARSRERRKSDASQRRQPPSAPFFVPGSSSVKLADSLSFCFQRALCGQPADKYVPPRSSAYHQPVFYPGQDGFLAEKVQLRGGVERLRRQRSNSTSTSSSSFNSEQPAHQKSTVSQLVAFVRKRPVMKHSEAAASTSNGSDKNGSVNDNGDFEFRLSSALAQASLNNKAQNQQNLNQNAQMRSKSPGTIINRFTNFARTKYRNSMHEKTANSVQQDTVRRDVNRELQRVKDEQATRVDLNSSDITVIPPMIKDLTQITELFLYKNKLCTLPPEIGCLTNLRILGLSENNLSSLPDSISSLKKLETLDLRHNKLTEKIPEVIFQMENLETLWLRYNKISHISPEIGRMRKLKMVDLRENKITSLPVEIGALEALSILLLSANHLKSLPEEIGNLSQLTQLDLQHNELQTLPASMGKLSGLKRLAIRYNQLSSLPASLAKCTELTEFIVESNKLSGLPEGLLVSLNQLKTINLSRNQLNAFPQGGPNQFESAITVNMEHNSISLIPFGIFSKANGLTKLNFKENQLTSLPLDFGTWTSLTELNVSNNDLIELPSDIDKLVNLEVLVLSTNRLRKLPSQIGSLRKLRELDLEENELECIPSDIGFLMSLTKLWIQSNKLTSLPRTIGNLLNLTDLRVGENMLSFIPEEIGHLENLKSLYLNDNPGLHSLPFELALCCSLEIMSIERCPLSQIPQDITEGGPSLVIQYLKMQGPYRGILM